MAEILLLGRYVEMLSKVAEKRGWTNLWYKGMKLEKGPVKRQAGELKRVQRDGFEKIE